MKSLAGVTLVAFSAFAFAFSGSAFAYLHPVHSRFLQRDPAGYVDGVNTYQYLRSNPLLRSDPNGTWAREKDTDTWCAESGDKLHTLAQMEVYGGDPKNSVCLWPVGDTKDHGYPNTINAGDFYDASSLTESGSDLDLVISHDMPGIDEYGKQYAYPPKVPNLIKDASHEGRTPIKFFFVAGHGVGGHSMGGAYELQDDGTYDFWKPEEGLFSASMYAKLPNEPPTFARAKEKKGPKRCWFTRKSEVRFAGCYTSALAKDFAGIALRKEAHAYGTKYYIQKGFPKGIEYSHDVTNDTPPKMVNPKAVKDWRAPEVWDEWPGGL